LPRRLADRFAVPLRLQVLEPPPSVIQIASSFDIVALRRDDISDPGIDWLLKALCSVAGEN